MLIKSHPLRPTALCVGALLVLGVAAGATAARADEKSERREDAVRMCGDYARQHVRDEGGNDVNVLDVRDFDMKGDRATARISMEAQWGRDRDSNKNRDRNNSSRNNRDSRDNEATVTCEVNFRGDNEVTDFDDNGLFKRRGD